MEIVKQKMRKKNNNKKQKQKTIITVMVADIQESTQLSNVFRIYVNYNQNAQHASYI